MDWVTNLRILSRKAIQTFLNNMVSVQILDQIDDAIAERTDNSLSLAIYQ